MEVDNKNKLLTLKEASRITGYSADYIGQLIRAGKIPGKQVYTNISWMTSAEAVLEYKKTSNNSKTSLANKVTRRSRRLAMELNIIKLFFKTFRYALPLLIILFISFLLLVFYVFHIFFSDNANIQIVPEIIEDSSISF